jgi:hypothetical protein
MVGIAQLAERLTVTQVVEGSSPSTHPNFGYLEVSFRQLTLHLGMVIAWQPQEEAVNVLRRLVSVCKRFGGQLRYQ